MKPKKPLVVIWGSHSVQGHSGYLANEIYLKFGNPEKTLKRAHIVWHREYDNSDLWDIADLALNMLGWIKEYDT